MERDYDSQDLEMSLKQSVLHLEEDKRLACNKIISQSLCFLLIQRADLSTISLALLSVLILLLRLKIRQQFYYKPLASRDFRLGHKSVVPAET